MTKKILTDLDATGRTITASTITGGTGTTDIALNSAATTSAASGAISIITGATTTSGTTGAISIKSGNSAAASGAITIDSGTSGSSAPGTITIGGTTANTVSVGSAATSVTLGQSQSSLGTSKSVYISGAAGATAVSTGVTSTVNLNNYYSVVGTSTTSIGGGATLPGTSTIDIGYFSGSVTGTNTIRIGSSGSTTTILGTLVASAPAGSLTGSSLASGITTASGLTTASSLASVGTITAGTWNGTAIAAGYGGTGQTSFTQYGVAYGASSTALAQTAAGTAGQVLTSNATSAPTWTDVGYTLISSVAFSGSAPSFTSIPGTYKKLVVQITFTATGSLSGAIQMTVNSAATISSTIYSTGSTTATVTTAGTSIVLSSGAPTVGDLMTVEIPNYAQTRPTMWISGGTGASSASSRWGVASTSAAITQITFTAGAGSFTGATGTAYLYGVD